MTVFRFPMFFTVVNRDEKVLFPGSVFAAFLREREGEGEGEGTCPISAANLTVKQAVDRK